MEETVIFPLSEDTGQKILAALLRIAVALESANAGGSNVSMAVSDGMLVAQGQGVDVADDMLTMEGGVTVADDMLTYEG